MRPVLLAVVLLTSLALGTPSAATATPSRDDGGRSVVITTYGIEGDVLGWPTDEELVAYRIQKSLLESVGLQIGPLVSNAQCSPCHGDDLWNARRAVTVN